MVIQLAACGCCSPYSCNYWSTRGSTFVHVTCSTFYCISNRGRGCQCIEDRNIGQCVSSNCFLTGGVGVSFYCVTLCIWHLGRIKGSPLAKKRLSFCLLISLCRLVVNLPDHPPVPFDFEVDPLLLRVVCCWSVFSAVAMIWHAVALHSDVDLISLLSASGADFTGDSTLSVLSTSIWASYCIRLTTGKSRSDVACD